MTSKKNNPIITAPVLIPYTPDCEYQYGEEVLPPEKIELLANSFNNYKIIDLQHEFTKRLINKQEPIPRGKLLKSYIAKEKLHLKGLDGYVREYPEGTWIISVEITDDEAKDLYYRSILTGLSITVKEKEHADAIIEFLNEHDIQYLPNEIIDVEKGFYKKPKRILMKDVMNPVAFTVSLVKSPCVYDAKFCKNSCMIVNSDKLKENKIVNLKEKIKSEINNFIDGLDVDEESVKEDVEPVETESEKTEDAPVEESVKEEGETEGEETTETPSEDEGEETEPDSEDDEDGDKGTGQGKVKEESKKEDLSEESEKSESKKCGEGKTIYGRKVKSSEVKKENIETESESDKDVLYLAQDEVENLISTTLRRYAEEIEQMVFDGIQEALDDYLFAEGYAYKENSEAEKEDVDEAEADKSEEVEEEAQKEYATPEMVQSLFDEQFNSFKSDMMESIKQAQQESIKSYSKAITPTDDGFEKKEAQKQTFTKKVQRDLNGCRIKRR